MLRRGAHCAAPCVALRRRGRLRYQGDGHGRSEQPERAQADADAALEVLEARAAARAVAGDEHRAPRQQGARDALRGEGGRPSGLLGVDGEHHVGALLRAPARARPGVGEATRSAGAARDQLSAGPARRALPDRAARVRGPAELSEPYEGPRPGRLLDRVGRASARRRRSGARSPTATWRGTSRCRAAGARSRCSATPSSTRARSGRRSMDPMVRAAGRGAVDRRRQPPVARPGRAGDRRRPDRRDVRGGGMADDHRQVRAAGCAACSSARAARRCAGGSTRCPTRSTSGCCAAGSHELRERLPGAGAAGASWSG